MSFDELNQPSVESNNIMLQNNEASVMIDINSRARKLVRIEHTINQGRYIKYLYSDPSLASYIRRPSQKPSYMSENTNTFKVDTPKLSGMYPQNINKIDNMTGPRDFESVIQKNVLEFQPANGVSLNRDAMRKFVKLEKIGDSNMNFIENKPRNTDIEIPIVPTISNKIVLKRM
jgi:hypothetical protein